MAFARQPRTECLNQSNQRHATTLPSHALKMKINRKTNIMNNLKHSLKRMAKSFNETMKTKLHSLFIGLAIIAGVHQTSAQVTNLGIAPAGGQSVLYWPASSPTNYVLQTVTNLSSTNWLTARTAFAVYAAEVTNAAPSGFFRLMPTTTPAGMALIPAGWFTMGDTLDGESDAIPTNIYVSAVVLGVTLVNYGLWTNVYAYAAGHGYNFVDAGVSGGTGTNYPVETVDW